MASFCLVLIDSKVGPTFSSMPGDGCAKQPVAPGVAVCRKPAFVALRCMSRRIIASSCVLHARSRYAFSFQCCTADSDNKFLTATRAFAELPFALTIDSASNLKRCVGSLSLRPLNVQKCAIGLRVSGPRDCLLSLQA